MTQGKSIVELLQGRADYAEYNYGAKSAITVACRAGDAKAFMQATQHITEARDSVLAQLQNVIIVRGV